MRIILCNSIYYLIPVHTKIYKNFYLQKFVHLSEQLKHLLYG